MGIRESLVCALLRVSRRVPLVISPAGKRIVIEDLGMHYELLKSVVSVFPSNVPSYPLLALCFRDLLTITGVSLEDGAPVFCLWASVGWQRLRGEGGCERHTRLCATASCWVQRRMPPWTGGVAR